MNDAEKRNTIRRRISIHKKKYIKRKKYPENSVNFTLSYCNLMLSLLKSVLKLF